MESYNHQEFFDHAAKLIGENNISRDYSTVAISGTQGQVSYGDPFFPETTHRPKGAVRPGSVEEVQGILRVANQFHVPLWTVSPGKNLGYGGSAPATKENVVLDLHRMNKILEINEEYAGYGPNIDGMFFQSNLAPGVVTKLGMHITPASEAYATVEVSVPREEDLVPLVGTLSDLMRRSIILNSPSIANIFRIALTSREPGVYEILGPYMKPGSNVPYEILEEIRCKQGWGFWKAYLSLYAPTEVLPSLITAVKRAFTTIEGIKIDYREFSGTPGKFINAQDIGEEEISHSGIPTLAPLAMLDSRQKGSGHICFSPIIPPSGRELYSLPNCEETNL
ncbi:hypothetical protein N7540_011880 [Penicillium herquei]|nr:hypothetical protein N7540_011880 [Penicillium herquei]